MTRFKTPYRAILVLLVIWAVGLTAANASASASYAGLDDFRTDEVRVAIMDHLDLDGVAITPRASGITLHADGRSFRVRADELIRFERDGQRVVARFERERVKADHMRLELNDAGAFDVVGRRNRLRGGGVGVRRDRLIAATRSRPRTPQSGRPSSNSPGHRSRSSPVPSATPSARHRRPGAGCV